jgi:hypothetical protein
MGMKRVLVLLAFSVLIFASCSNNQQSSNSTPSPEEMKLKEEIETKRMALHNQTKDLIQPSIDAGVFTKVEDNYSKDYNEYFVKLYVGEVFYTLKIDDKKNTLNVVYFYYESMNPKSDTAVYLDIYDGYSGKKIGHYDGSNLDLNK